MADLSCCKRDYTTWKTENIYYLALYGKRVSTPVVNKSQSEEDVPNGPEMGRPDTVREHMKAVCPGLGRTQERRRSLSYVPVIFLFL